MATWGETTIKILAKDYRPPYQEGGMNKFNLLPDTSDPSATAEAIQQRNTGTEMVKGRLVLTSYSEYSALLSDMLSGTERTLVAPDCNGTYVIERMSEPERIHGGLYFVNIEFVAVV